jgi:hypothetical protein
MLFRRKRLLAKKDHAVIDKRLPERFLIFFTEWLRQIDVVDHCADQRFVLAYAKILVSGGLRLLVEHGTHGVLLGIDRSMRLHVDSEDYESRMTLPHQISIRRMNMPPQAIPLVMLREERVHQ